MKNNKFLIINRTFWPDNDVIGEALLSLAEKTSKNVSTYVVCLSTNNIKEKLLHNLRGSGIQFKVMKALTSSSSGLFFRILESFLFTFWTLICLFRIRPSKIYFSTDPPLIIPFTVFIYSKLFKCKYVYHLQDIHPEASNLIVNMNSIFYKLFISLDNMTINGASRIITLSQEMKDYIITRSDTNATIDLISNCAIECKNTIPIKKDNEFIFCGNMGRLQLIPILIEAITEYFKRGGILKFTFIGAGINSNLISDLAKRNKKVTYLGQLSSQKASEYLSKKQWAILSIEDEVTKYAFPSKTSSYIINDCKILAICGENTSVANFINQLDLGMVSKPFKNEIIENFFKIEKKEIEYNQISVNYKKEITVDKFVNKIIDSIEL